MTLFDLRERGFGDPRADEADDIASVRVRRRIAEENHAVDALGQRGAEIPAKRVFESRHPELIFPGEDGPHAVTGRLELGHPDRPGGIRDRLRLAALRGTGAGRSVTGKLAMPGATDSMVTPRRIAALSEKSLSSHRTELATVSTPVAARILRRGASKRSGKACAPILSAALYSPSAPSTVRLSIAAPM